MFSERAVVKRMEETVGDEMLNKTVRDLVDLVRNIFGPDLSLGESVQAN